MNRIAKQIQVLAQWMAGLLLFLTFGCSGEETTEVQAQIAANEVRTSDSLDDQTPENSSPAAIPPKRVVDTQTFDNIVRPFFERHCIDCHGKDDAEAELRLDTLAANFGERPAADHWVEVLDRLNLGEMPPQDQPRPDEIVLAKVISWITLELQYAQSRAQSTGGRVLLRRLTRLEYANTVRDLFDLDYAHIAREPGHSMFAVLRVESGMTQ